MSVRQSINWLAEQRVDVPSLKAIDSSVIFDFSTLVKAFAGDSPYILSGFSMPVSGIGGPATALQLVVANSVVWIPDDANGAFLRVESGVANEVLNSANPDVIGSFTAGTNYVGLQFVRATDPTTNDLITFWDVDSSSEYTQTVPTGLVMNYQIVISNTGFGTTAPVAIVNVSGSNVVNIENAKQGMFRLGTGGQSPNIDYETTFTIENALLATSNSAPDPFQGGDWAFNTFKDWMNAVMSRLKRLGGGAFWYTDAGSAPSNINLAATWFDAVGSVFTGAGVFRHSAIVPGLLTWNGELYIKSIIGSLVLSIAPGTVTLNDGDVAYIQIIRDQDFQAINTFTFTHGSATITSVIPITGIVAGDWVRFSIDNLMNYAQVLSVSGTSITLTSAYNGTSGTGKALRTQGSYTMLQGNSSTIPNSSDVYWVAKRDDNAVNTATVTAAVRTANVVTYTTAAAHSFMVGVNVVVAGMISPYSDLNGTFEVASVPTSNTLTINQSGNDETATGFGTIASSAIIYLKYFGELVQGEERQISDTISNDTLAYIGSSSDSDSVPNYLNSPNGSLVLPNYNTIAGENLTQRISKLTAMLADVNQNFNLIVDPGLVTWDGSTLGMTSASVSIPGTTVGASPVPINTVSAAVPVGSAVYINISRTSGSTLTASVATIASLTPAQQQLIIAQNPAGSILLR